MRAASGRAGRKIKSGGWWSDEGEERRLGVMPGATLIEEKSATGRRVARAAMAGHQAGARRDSEGNPSDGITWWERATAGLGTRPASPGNT